MDLNLSQAGNVTITVYNITGKEVMKPYNGWMNNGETKVLIDQHLASGVYIINVVAGESVMQQKLVVQ